MAHQATPGLGRGCPHFQHGLKLHEHGDLESARDTLLQSVDADFNNPHAWALLSAVYEEMDEPEHAAEAARQAVRSEPTNPDWHALKGQQVQLEGRRDEAELAFAEALRINPRHGRALFERARMNAMHGRDVEAAADLNQALECEPALCAIVEHVEAFEGLLARKLVVLPSATDDGPESSGDNPFLGLRVSPGGDAR